jgi:hypothetical protein
LQIGAQFADISQRFQVEQFVDEICAGLRPEDWGDEVA